MEFKQRKKGWRAKMNEMNENCKIVPKKIKRIEIRLFEEEIEEAEGLCYLLDLSYEQLFATLVKQELNKRGI